MSSRFAGAATLCAALLFVAPLCAQRVSAPPQLVQKCYSVADLLVPPGSTAETPPAVKAPDAPPIEGRLVGLITSSVKAKTWACNGGRGGIEYFPLTMSLVVTQTPDVHEQIADLLAALRKTQDTEVALEVRLVSVSEAVFERVGIDFPDSTATTEVSAVSPERTGKDLLLMNEAQLALFMESVLGDRRVNVMQAPKMTLFNGQRADINLTDKRYFVTSMEESLNNGQVVYCPKNEPKETGLRISARPVVAADGTRVQLDFKMDWTQLASEEIPLMPVTTTIRGSDNSIVPFTQFVQQPRFNTVAFERSAVIPDGQTVLLGRFRQVCEVRNEYGPPVLSKIPYVNRLFKNVGYGRESKLVCVLVTPRIILPQEEERPTQTGVVCDPFADKADVKILTCPKAAEPTADGRKVDVLATLLKEYDRACLEGRTEEADRFGRAALVLDPKCFHKK